MEINKEKTTVLVIKSNRSHWIPEDIIKMISNTKGVIWVKQVDCEKWVERMNEASRNLQGELASFGVIEEEKNGKS